MAESSRRSFFIEALQKAAGAWVVLTGGGVVALSALSACVRPVTKYGGPPQDLGPGPVAPVDVGPAPVTKYGGPPRDLELELDPGVDAGPRPMAKYGGPPPRRR